MHSVGIDLHRSRSHVAVIDGEGNVLLSRRIINDPALFLELLGELEGDCRIALEATYGWEWLADVLQDAGYELHLSHPLRTKAIASARVKTDAVDAKTLAHLLRTDLLPEAYIAAISPHLARCSAAVGSDRRRSDDFGRNPFQVGSVRPRSACPAGR